MCTFGLISGLPFITFAFPIFVKIWKQYLHTNLVLFIKFGVFFKKKIPHVLRRIQVPLWYQNPTMKIAVINKKHNNSNNNNNKDEV